MILSFNSDAFEQSPVPMQGDSLASSRSHIYYICMDKKDATHKIGKNRRDPGGRWRHTLTMKTHDTVLLAIALDLRRKSDEWWWFAWGLRFALELWRKSDEWARQALTSSSSPPFRASDTLWLLLLLMIRHKLCSRLKKQRICATVRYNSQCCCLRMFCIDTALYNPRLSVETVDNSRLAG